MSLIVGIGGFFAIEIMGLFQIHYLYAAALMLIFSLSVLYIGSKLSPGEPNEKLKGLIWTPNLWTEETEELKNVPFWKNYRYLAALLILTTAVIVGWFW